MWEPTLDAARCRTEVETELEGYQATPLPRAARSQLKKYLAGFVDFIRNRASGG